MRGLGVGVGTEQTELQLVRLGGFASYHLYDVSQAALDAGASEARRLGIDAKARFICQDIQSVELEPNAYDVITVIASLHHIDDLEATLAKCRAALAPKGIL